MCHITHTARGILWAICGPWDDPGRQRMAGRHQGGPADQNRRQEQRRAAQTRYPDPEVAAVVLPGDVIGRATALRERLDNVSSRGILGVMD